MKYKHTSYDLDSDIIGFFSIYIIISPYAYYAAESNNKIIHFKV